jgi:peroxiredoxin
VDIEPTGIILRGLEAVGAWADPYVEFDQVPSQSQPTTGPGGGVGGFGQNGPDYTALNTWIPGGTITEYVWSVSDNNQLYPFGTDPNKFVLVHSRSVTEADVVSVGSIGSTLPPYTPLCLTVQGTRPAFSGAGPAVAVSASVCGVHQLPLPGIFGDAGALPAIALTRRGPSGNVVVTGHAAAQAARGAAPNLLVHFADAKSAANLKALSQALHHAKRGDAPTAVMAVVPLGHLEQLHYTAGVIYAENNAAWERAFGLGKAARPLTVVVNPTGKVVWHHEGAIEHSVLSAALAKELVPTFIDPPKLARLNATLGQPAPNFLFEYTPGHALPLTKLKGRRVVLVFWRSGSAPSLQAIATAQHAKNGAQPPLVLAINDGEAADHTHRALSQAKISAIPVADPGRLIATAYGVSAWPTIISIDASGIISGIQIGNAAGAQDHVSAHANK